MTPLLTTPEVARRYGVSVRKQARILPSEEVMARRRFQQRGHLFEQGGWWKLRWKQDQRQADGTIKRGWSPVVVVGPSKSNEQMDGWGIRQARREAWERFLSKLDQNNWTPQSVITFAEFVERKYRPEHMITLEKNTRDSYESMLRRYIIPGLGPKRLSEIRRDDVQMIIGRLADHPRTAQLTLMIISGVFHLAEDCEWLATGNPARRVRLRKPEKRERGALTWEQVDLVLAAMPPLYRPLLKFLALTGMRPAEAAGLRWSKVDMEGPAFEISIRETYTNSHWKQTPKNDNSRREVPMTVDVWMLLQEVWEHTLHHAPNHPVFANRRGGPLHMGNINKRHLKPAGEAAGLPGLTWYDFRHTASTRADQAMTVAEKARIFGHESGMNRRYTHPGRETLRERLEKAGPKGLLN